jgi:hypothetical protein
MTLVLLLQENMRTAIAWHLLLRQILENILLPATDEYPAKFPSLFDHNPDPLGPVHHRRNEHIPRHHHIPLSRLKQLQGTLLAWIPYAAKNSKDARDTAEQFRLGEIDANTCTTSSGKSHHIFLKTGVIDKALGVVGMRVGEDGLQVVDVVNVHACWCLRGWY